MPSGKLQADSVAPRGAFGYLKFAPALEEEFRQQQIGQTRLRMRVGATLLLVVMAAYMVVDCFRLRAAAESGAWQYISLILTLRLLPMLPVTAVLLMLSKDNARGQEASLRTLAVTALALLGASTLGVLILHFQKTELNNISFSLNGMSLVVMACFFPSGIPYRSSLILATGLTLTTLVAMPLALPQSAMASFYVFAPYMVLTALVSGGAALLHELAQRRQFLLERQLRYAAERDTLTGLYNRGTFMLLGEQTLATARRSGMTMSLLLVDIDHFKAYNDQYGHPAGDAALATVADAIARIGTRDVDLAARLGGEEFAVVLYGTPAHQAATMAEAFRLRVQNELSLEHKKSSTHAHLTVSVGVAAPDSRINLAALYKQADEALYVAKKTGRNKVSVSPPSVDTTGLPVLRTAAPEVAVPPGTPYTVH